MSRVDLQSPVALLGIALVVAAAVGGGAKVLGSEIPVLSTVERQVLVAVLGGVLFVGAQLVHGDAKLRVVSAAAAWDSSTVFQCAGTENFTGQIHVAGEQTGTVQYRFTVNGSPGPLQSLSVPGKGTFAVQGSHQFRYAPGLPPLGPLRLQLVVLSPNNVASPIAPLTVFCR